MNRRSLLAALAGATTLTALTACNDDGWESDDTDADCDKGDLRERDPDCGYYDDRGAWVLYPWVKPNVGGKPPAGQRPKPPAGTKGAPPRRGTSGGGSRSGGGTRTGGGRTGTGGSGVRSGGGGRR